MTSNVKIIFSIITSLVFLLIASQCGGAELLTPVKNLEASLAAAAAHGTIVAVTARLESNGADGSDFATIILTRSPTVRSNLTIDYIRNHGSDEFGEGDEVLEYSSDKHMFRSSLFSGPVPTTSGMVHLLHPSLVVGMTGFASDVRYLSRFLANLNMNYEHLHGRSSSSAAGNLSTLKTARALSSKIANVAMVSGARPYGVEAVVIGIGSICTTDPSGSSHRWDKATAVGKYSHQIRKYLVELLCNNIDRDFRNELTEYPISIREALECAFQATLKAHKDVEGDFRNMSPEQFECIVIWSKACQDISSHTMKVIYHGCVKALTV